MRENTFKEIFKKGYTINISSNSKFDRIIYKNLKCEWLIKYNKENRRIWIRNEYIWSVFEEKYNMNFDEIKDFMKNMLFKHFKISKKILDNSKVNC